MPKQVHKGGKTPTEINVGSKKRHNPKKPKGKAGLPTHDFGNKFGKNSGKSMAARFNP